MIHGWHNNNKERNIISMNSFFSNTNRDCRRIIKITGRIILISFIFAIIINITYLNSVYAEEKKRSSSLSVEKTIDGDTERIDFVDEDGNITYAVDKHYASVLKIKNGNILQEVYLDASGKPAIQSLGHYALVREYNEKNQCYKITYLGIDGNPVIINLGYSIVIRTFNTDGYIESEMYYDIAGKPIETSKLAYGCYKKYNENGRNIQTTFLDQNHKPTVSGKGYSIIRRIFYEEDTLAGKVREEYYFDKDGTPISLSLGQFGISNEYDEFGRVNAITYLDQNGVPIITNEGYTVVKRTFNEDDSIKTEHYYDIKGKPIALSEGQYGYRIEDGERIYVDLEGNEIFNLRNYLYSHQNSVIIICAIVVFASTFVSRNCNIIILLVYILFILYMTFLYRKSVSYYCNLKLFWSYAQFFYNKQLRWEIINNILLYIPLGTILSQILPRKRVLFFIICLSFVIELVQLVTRTGLCEIDDLISNTIGGVIGYILGIALVTITRHLCSTKLHKS